MFLPGSTFQCETAILPRLWRVGQKTQLLKIVFLARGERNVPFRTDKCLRALQFRFVGNK